MPSGKRQEQKVLKQTGFEAIMGGVEYGKLQNTFKAFCSKCSKTNDTVCAVSSASPRWAELYTILDRKLSSPFRSLALCNQLLSLLILTPLVMFGKDRGPLGSLIIVFFDNSMSPQTPKSRATVLGLWTVPLRNSQKFQSSSPFTSHPSLNLR